MPINKGTVGGTWVWIIIIILIILFFVPGFIVEEPKA
jgi:hypothetical protein